MIGLVLVSRHSSPLWYTGPVVNNRPFPSSRVPLFQGESKCETILMKMTLICMKMKLHGELIFIWKVSHLDSFWNRGTRELGNGLFAVNVQLLEWVFKMFPRFYVKQRRNGRQSLVGAGGGGGGIWRHPYWESKIFNIKARGNHGFPEFWGQVSVW